MSDHSYYLLYLYMLTLCSMRRAALVIRKFDHELDQVVKLTYTEVQLRLLGLFPLRYGSYNKGFYFPCSTRSIRCLSQARARASNEARISGERERWDTYPQRVYGEATSWIDLRRTRRRGQYLYILLIPSAAQIRASACPNSKAAL